MKKLLYIRADANQKLGIGHVMRCLPVATEWQRRGNEVRFLVSDEESLAFVHKKGFSAISLDSDGNNIQDEIPKIFQILKKEEGWICLVDSYAATQAYFDSLRTKIPTAYLSGLKDTLFQVDVPINYSILLDGCSYFPIRDEFYGKEAHVKDTITDIFVSTGGTDPYQIAYRIATSPLSEAFRIHLILGNFYTNRKELYSLGQGNPNLIYYENVRDMASVMCQCDLAICAGGVTLYELCACGVPAFAYRFADNQKESVLEFERRGLAVNLGDVREQNPEEWIKSVCTKVTAFSVSQRIKMNEKQKKCIDKNGAKRIADLLEQR